MNLSGILNGSEDPQRLTAYARLFGEPGWSGGDFGAALATDAAATRASRITVREALAYL